VAAVIVVAAVVVALLIWGDVLSWPG
jgi:hypothetical protein